MKALILLTLLGAGASVWSLTPSADECAPPSSECRATVQCTPQGTCLVICYDENGAERCREEIPCDRPCDERECGMPGDCPAQRCAR